MDRNERREQEVLKLATAALWYAWGQIDPVPGQDDSALRKAGFDTEHGQEFGRLYEQVAREYIEEKRSSRFNIIDGWREFVASKKRLGIAATLTVDDIDYNMRYERERAAKVQP